MTTIDYQKLVEEALLGVVRGVLARVAEEGLPGEHHFYLTFASEAPGVELPDERRATYPTSMTVVLRHQFWDLEVDDHRFAVTLAFGGARRRLVVPFAALLGFVDPAVRFAVRFGDGGGEGAQEETRPPGQGDERAEEEGGEAAGFEADNVVRFDRFGRD